MKNQEENTEQNVSKVLDSWIMKIIINCACDSVCTLSYILKSVLFSLTWQLNGS